MKSIIGAILLVFALALAAPTSQAQSFMAALSGPNESPANASPGTGTAYVTINGNTMRVQVTFSGLTGNTTASHIHASTTAPFTGTTGVATTTPTFAGFPTGVTSGSYDNTLDMTLASSYNSAYITANGGTPTTAEAALFAAIPTGKTYLNIHTSTFSGGEIRGFLIATPEPGTVGFLIALAASGTLAIRRRKPRLS